MKVSSSSSSLKEMATDFAKISEMIISLNEYQLNDKNSFILIAVSDQLFLYIHEKNFNPVVYLLLMIIELLEQSGTFELNDDLRDMFRCVYFDIQKIFFPGEFRCSDFNMKHKNLFYCYRNNLILKNYLRKIFKIFLKKNTLDIRHLYTNFIMPKRRVDILFIF